MHSLQSDQEISVSTDPFTVDNHDRNRLRTWCGDGDEVCEIEIVLLDVSVRERYTFLVEESLRESAVAAVLLAVDFDPHFDLPFLDFFELIDSTK